MSEKYEQMNNDPRDPPPPYSEIDQQKAMMGNLPNVHVHNPPSSEYQHVNMQQGNYGSNYGATIIDQPVPVTQVILIGGCPVSLL